MKPNSWKIIIGSLHTIDSCTVFYSIGIGISFSIWIDALCLSCKCRIRWVWREEAGESATPEIVSPSEYTIPVGNRITKRGCKTRERWGREWESRTNSLHSYHEFSCSEYCSIADNISDIIDIAINCPINSVDKVGITLCSNISGIIGNHDIKPVFPKWEITYIE